MPLIAIHHSVFFIVTRSCGMLYDNSECHQKKRLITDYLTQSGTEAQNMVWKCSCNNTELCNRSSNRLNFNFEVVIFTLGWSRSVWQYSMDKPPSYLSYPIDSQMLYFIYKTPRLSFRKNFRNRSHRL